jgi:uncharacterized protein (TIGR00106 family)
MSVLMEFSMFPTDKGESVSSYVSKIIDMVRSSGFDYRLTAMGTVVETETLMDAVDIINKAYEILEPFTARVYCNAKFDIRKDQSERIEAKIESIESRIGKIKR